MKNLYSLKASRRVSVHHIESLSYANPEIRSVRNQDMSPGIATGYGLDGQSSIPGKDNKLLYPTASRPAVGPSRLPTGVVALS